MSADSLEMLCNRGRQEIRRKDYPQAIQSFQAAVAIDPLHLPAHEGLATALFLNHEYDRAVECFQEIHRLEPTRTRALINIGAIHNKRKDYKKALEVLRRAVARDRRIADAYYNMGLAHKGLNQLSMAVSAYKEAIKLAPEMPEAHQNLANVYVDMKNNQQAIIHFQKALELRPDFERARLGLAEAEMRRDEAKRSINPFGRLVDDKTLEGAKGTVRIHRELSESERIDDRVVLRRLAIEISGASSQFLAHLKGSFEPHLLALNRVVAQSDETAHQVAEEFDQFRKSCDETKRLRRDMKRKLLELRGHEELVNTPSLR